MVEAKLLRSNKVGISQITRITEAWAKGMHVIRQLGVYRQQMQGNLS